MDDDIILCPDCGEPLRDDWYGLLACFCRWDGQAPQIPQEAVDEVCWVWEYPG